MPMFQRRHYEALASVVRTFKVRQPTNDHIAADILVDLLADLFTSDNPNFDIDRFMLAVYRKM